MKATRSVLDYVPSEQSNELIGDWLLTDEYDNGEVEQYLDSLSGLRRRAAIMGLKVEFTDRAKKQAWAEFRRRYGR